MYKCKQVLRVASLNFRGWHRNPRVIMTFVLAFMLCMMLTNNSIAFAEKHGSVMQVMEAFVWTFGDANSIMISSLLLILLFADMPFLTPATPYYLVRSSRDIWLLGQVVYVVLATCAYLLFIFAVTAIISAPISFAGNQWSETGALIGYSGMGAKIAIPASVKTMEMSLPFACAGNVFMLMVCYMLLGVSIMLFFNLYKGKFWGVLSFFAYSIFGFFLNPQSLQMLFGLPEGVAYKANIAVGWLSPLNHATYYMHNFGYDYLPRMWMSYVIFGLLIVLCFWLAKRQAKTYSFTFTGAME